MCVMMTCVFRRFLFGTDGFYSSNSESSNTFSSREPEKKKIILDFSSKKDSSSVTAASIKIDNWSLGADEESSNSNNSEEVVREPLGGEHVLDGAGDWGENFGHFIFSSIVLCMLQEEEPVTGEEEQEMSDLEENRSQRQKYQIHCMNSSLEGTSYFSSESQESLSRESNHRDTLSSQWETPCQQRSDQTSSRR